MKSNNKDLCKTFLVNLNGYIGNYEMERLNFDLFRKLKNSYVCFCVIKVVSNEVALIFLYVLWSFINPSFDPGRLSKVFE